MSVYQDPAFVHLFETYTARPDSVGANLTALALASMRDDPLVVATGTDIAVFPGGGRAPSVQGFRLSTKGFKELAAVSHLGPALASLVRMAALAPDGEAWRADAQRLLVATRAARAGNSAALWRDRIAVEAYRGREDAIAAMLDYGCALAIRYLEAVLADPRKLTGAWLRAEVLEAKGSELGAPVPFNAVMIATFFLTGLDISHRIMDWFAREGIDWARAMVLVCGKQGRPTSGVTWTSNSVAQMILAASNGKLALERLYIAPHAEAFTAADAQDLAAVASFEEPLRRLWAYTRAICDLGPLMFDGYPRYAPDAGGAPRIDAETTSLPEMPRISGPDDMLAMTARLRLVMEDPRQLLSGCVTDYAAEQLRANGNDPAAVTVPGLDGYSYPAQW
jgi:hypothetical protein